MPDIPVLKVGTGCLRLELVDEPTVLLTFRGYAPAIRVKDLDTNLDYLLYIGAKSLAEPLEELRIANRNRFAGLRIRVCKESEQPMAKYILEPYQS